MLGGSFPPNEVQRVAALRNYDILNCSEDEIFNALVRAAARVCMAPMAVLSFVDSNRQWLKATFGPHASEGGRSMAFSSHTIHQKDVFIVEDAAQDERFRDDPFVIRDRAIRFYAGIAIQTEGTGVGALSVMDWIPRTLDDEQIQALRLLGEAAGRILQLRQHQGFAVFAKAVDLASDGVTIASETTTGFKILYANESFLRLTGYEFHEVINRDCTFTFAEGCTDVEKSFRLSCEERRVTTTECRISRKDGSVAWDRVTFVPFVDELERLVYTVALHRDITSVKELEAEASQLHAMRTTMATVNHVINNFMNSAQLYSQQIAAGVQIQPKERHLFEAALRSTQYQLAAINRMGAFKDRPTPFGISLLDLDDRT